MGLALRAGADVPESPFTIIDGGRAVEVPAAIAGDGVRLSPAALAAALGWEVSPEGLCREGLCVPVPEGWPGLGPAGVDLARLAALLERPLALDLDERAAYLGGPARERSRALASLRAPDFTLPDLHGRLHALSAQRGRKVLLVAWASW